MSPLGRAVAGRERGSGSRGGDGDQHERRAPSKGRAVHGEDEEHRGSSTSFVSRSGGRVGGPGAQPLGRGPRDRSASRRTARFARERRGRIESASGVVGVGHLGRVMSVRPVEYRSVPWSPHAFKPTPERSWGPVGGTVAGWSLCTVTTRSMVSRTFGVPQLQPGSAVSRGR